VQRHPATRLAEQTRQLESSRETLRRSIFRQLDQQAVTLKNLSRRLSVHQPGRKLSELASRIDIARRSLERSMSGAVTAKQQQLIDLARTLNAVSPLQTIGRGYAVITSADSGDVISSVSQVEAGDSVSAQLKDGKLDCTVDTVN